VITDDLQTVIRGGDLDGFRWRYATQKEAEIGHRGVVHRLQEGGCNIVCWQKNLPRSFLCNVAARGER
jgi:hypothetical protein